MGNICGGGEPDPLGGDKKDRIMWNGSFSGALTHKERANLGDHSAEIFNDFVNARKMNTLKKGN